MPRIAQEGLVPWLQAQTTPGQDVAPSSPVGLAGVTEEGRGPPLLPASMYVRSGTHGVVILPALWRVCPGSVGQNVQPT